MNNSLSVVFSVIAALVSAIISIGRGYYGGLGLSAIFVVYAVLLCTMFAEYDIEIHDESFYLVRPFHKEKLDMHSFVILNGEIPVNPISGIYDNRNNIRIMTNTSRIVTIAYTEKNLRLLSQILKQTNDCAGLSKEIESNLAKFNSAHNA